MSKIALSALQAELQTFLRDTLQKKWSAADLAMFINIAISQWTTDVPIASSQEYSVVSDQHAYDLPDNAVTVYSVHGYFTSTAQVERLGPVQMLSGSWEEDNEPVGFVVGFPIDTQFYLPREPQGTSFTLYYGAVHPSLSAAGDELDLRSCRWGEQAVIAYAAYLAYLPYSASRARLRQWARRPELDTGNPLADEAQRWLDTYYDLLARYAEPVAWRFVSAEGL